MVGLRSDQEQQLRDYIAADVELNQLAVAGNDKAIHELLNKDVAGSSKAVVSRETMLAFVAQYVPDRKITEKLKLILYGDTVDLGNQHLYAVFSESTFTAGNEALAELASKSVSRVERDLNFTVPRVVDVSKALRPTRNNGKIM